jgi:hypothetical protein
MALLDFMTSTDPMARERRLRLAQGLAGMSLRPNVGLQTAIQGQLEDIKTQRAQSTAAAKLEQQKAVAAQLLGDKFPMLSGALQAGIMSPTDVVKAARQGGDAKVVGDALVAPDGTVIYQGAPKKTALEQQYDKAVAQGFEGTMLDYQVELNKAKRSVTNVNLPSEGERKSATLASRINFAMGQMQQAIAADPEAAKPETLVEGIRAITGLEALPNMLTAPQRQVVETAQLDVLDAALTLGTGAAYTREQLLGYQKAYFPQIGDDEKTIAAKQKRLQNLLETAYLAAGRASSQIPSAKVESYGTSLPQGVTVKKISD